MPERAVRLHITAKMNSLCDKDIIAALYEASCAGVKIASGGAGHLLLKGRDPGTFREHPGAIHCGRIPGARQDLYF